MSSTSALIGRFIRFDGELAEIIRVLGTWSGFSAPVDGDRCLIVTVYLSARETVVRHVLVAVTRRGRVLVHNPFCPLQALTPPNEHGSEVAA